MMCCTPPYRRTPRPHQSVSAAAQPRQCIARTPEALCRVWVPGTLHHPATAANQSTLVHSSSRTSFGTRHSMRQHVTRRCTRLQAIITDMHGQNRYIDARTCAGLTPLHMAAWAGHVEVAKILLANGAFLNPKIVFSSPSTSSVLPGSTPTHLATRKNRIHVVKALLSAYVRRRSPAPVVNSRAECTCGMQPRRLRDGWERLPGV